MKTTELLNSRWLIRRDMVAILSMCSIREEDLLNLLRQRNVIGVIVETEFTCEPVGFYIYELDKDDFTVLHYGDNARIPYNEFIGCMVDRLAAKLSDNRRTKFHVNVPEHDLTTQLELADCKLLGSQIEDMVVMTYYL